MPTAVTDLPVVTDPPRKRWTREQYERLPECALNGERLELIDGELINKMGKKRPHVIALAMLHSWLNKVFGDRFVNSQAPIDVSAEDNSTSEPEPDLIVLRREMTVFRDRNPGPDDIHLVSEIADTTLGFDLAVKAALYARAGITEYWVLDIAGRRLIVHRDPHGGRYRTVSAYGEHERLAPLAAPGCEVRVGDVLP